MGIGCHHQCHQIMHHHLIFVFSNAFDAVITIYTAKQYLHQQEQYAMIDEIVNDLFENDNAFLSEHCDVLLPQYLPTTECSFGENNSSISTIGEQPTQYHTIYMKPIVDRLRQLTNSSYYSEEIILKIVDETMKNGTKRKISKRTFEFKHGMYTMIMSKSLNTILDFAVAKDDDDGDVITVHPDVVSIVSKSHKFLNYFSIQDIAKKAKLNGEFTKQKHDYRQQFSYSYNGWRIVFASNHTTIVEFKWIKANE